MPDCREGDQRYTPCCPGAYGLRKREISKEDMRKYLITWEEWQRCMKPWVPVQSGGPRLFSEKRERHRSHEGMGWNASHLCLIVTFIFMRSQASGCLHSICSLGEAQPLLAAHGLPQVEEEGRWPGPMIRPRLRYNGFHAFALSHLPCTLPPLSSFTKLTEDKKMKAK